MNYDQSLNRVELIGQIGNVRRLNAGNAPTARFSVATNYMYKDSEGAVVIETTWTDCSAFASNAVPAEALEALQQGTAVHVVGRLTMQRFVDAEGKDRRMAVVAVSRLNIINNPQ